MAKDKSSSKDKSSKKEKKDKSLSKHSPDGVTKSSKREKHSTSVTPENADRLLQELDGNARTPAADADESMLDIDATPAAAKPIGALVPFANPLADEKTAKKVFKSVKKANKSKALKRGVKEVVKTLRKSPLATPSSLSSTTLPSGVVVIAADISPMDVISHLPVLCEDHGVPYVYVTSRAELGAAGQTKRPTSVVLIGREQGKPGKKAKDVEKEKEEKAEEWSETYAELVKVVRKAGKDVRI